MCMQFSKLSMQEILHNQKVNFWFLNSSGTLKHIYIYINISVLELYLTKLLTHRLTVSYVHYNALYIDVNTEI